MQAETKETGEREKGEKEKERKKEKKEKKVENGTDKATQSCSHGFSLCWQKFFGDPVCTGVTDILLTFKFNF